MGFTKLMIAFATTLIILGLVLLGAAAGWRRLFPNETAEKGVFLTLFLLMMLMGFSTARLENIELYWSVLGATAALGALLPLLGTWLFHGLAGLLLNRKGQQLEAPIQEKSTDGPCLVCVFRLPLVMISFAVFGFFLGWLTPFFRGVNTDLAVDVVLYVLVFLVGYQFGFARRNIAALFLRWENLVLPLITILGSLVSALFLPPLTGWKLSESLALVSGMGWYSLSSVLITGLGNPVLGSSAFLANLFRETISLLVIPFLFRLKQRNMAIASPGAASMDVALPLLETFGGVDTVPLALAHGLLVTIMVPPLVLLWMGLGF